MDADINLLNPEVEVLKANKQSGLNYRQRRHEAWDETYLFYRDRVITNRLIQRQSVNLPLTKTVIRTLLKDMDDLPVNYYENLDNDKQAELFLNEYWRYIGEINKFEIQDIVDKKQEGLFGRSFDQWQIIDGKIRMTVQDPMDILVDRYCDPTNIHTARFLIHNHIFEPLSKLESNPNYDKKAITRLKEYYATEAGLIKVATNQQMLTEKNQKLADMGVPDVNSPILGETICELSLHFVYDRREGSKEEELFLKVEVDDMEIIMKKPLEEVIGVTKDHYFKNHYPYCSWADDIERQDFWSDGIGDVCRTPNKILNAWFSQMVENRTMRSFGMNFYDSTNELFKPQTYEPKPFGWFGVPGNPNEIIRRVDIPDLSESLDEMNFVIGMVEKASGATSTQQGVQTERKITLGEVQLALGEAKERIRSISKFYNQVWKDRGEMFLKLLEAGGDKIDAVKIYKKGRNSNEIYSREISPKDWTTEAGYRVRVWSQEDKNTQDSEKLQKLSAVKQNIPGNMKLDEIYQRKLLEFAGLTPDEINEVMELEKEKLDMMMNPDINGVNNPAMLMNTPPMLPAPALNNQPQV